ncbi:PREDICTED: uncharacterized protein LOC109236969 [Nicotiana attenuata]|uniref:uncharacterized protein LOC109236969 n=1 Tax=Nicotiana attenuata TaxID=49451 RepID=UPI00090466DB|nr:PREDICTED: uncharacterized protein LOC109236969 [Nicotiana attenuata]
MTMILDLLRDAFEDAKLPPSFYEAKKTISKLGLDYTKIPACPNNCMLYWEGDSELEACKHCGTSKWNPNKKKKQAAKVLRYFPLKARLQQLFMCCKTAEHMRWHALGNNADGLMRHPRDGEAWKTFDRTHSEFASDPRNVRLGLASDGFSPFGTMSTTYSIWPVFLIPYNLPPWMCMKHTSFILSMIIPGKHMPGNNIDVYLQPLVKELHELWNDGVETFDSSLNENFRMHAALMWTISDFPGLGILSGWNTHTGFASPTCNFDTEPCRLRHSKKWCFMGHRRFLRRNHRFRLNRVRFNGSTEERNPPLKLSGSAILRQIEEGRGAELNCRGKRSRRATKQWNKRKQLPPLAIRNVLPDHVVAVLVDFCSFFKALSSKTLNVSEPDKLQEHIESTLCHLEILFPPAFFTVMVHLSVHLAEEAKLGGPVHHRNMYPVERELGHFKSFVRNKAQPEGSIAEGYLAEESLTFCSRYIEDIETRFNRPRRVRDDPNVTEPSGTSSIFPQLGKPASASITFPLTDMQKLQAH